MVRIWKGTTDDTTPYLYLQVDKMTIKPTGLTYLDIPNRGHFMGKNSLLKICAAPLSNNRKPN